MTLNVRRVWDLYASGCKPRKIAKTLGISVGAVTNRLDRAKEELGMRACDVEEREAETVPRCRCGLMLPCYDHAPAVPSGR